MEYQVLGPLQATVGSRRVSIGGQRSQVVLAALLVEPGHVVSTEHLIAAVWDDAPPTTARTQIAIAVSGLRRSFNEAGGDGKVIQTVRPGYQVQTHAVRIDAQVAEEQVAKARRAAAAGRLDEAASAFRAALAHWRGPVLAGLDRTGLAAGIRRLEELRLTAIEECAEVELARGRHHELIGELMHLVSEQPFRERARALLMTALARSGRRAEALAVYREGHDLFSDELGLEPGRGLRELNEAILTDRPSVRQRPAPPREGQMARRRLPYINRSRYDAARRLRRPGRRHR